MIRKLYAITVITLCSCASSRAPEGGPIDKQAPVVTKDNINTINYKAGKIELEFDEYIEFSNPSQDIKIYPGTFNFKSKVIKKKLIIETDSTFKENTTYTLRIENIKDINEKNSLNYSKSFSTGNVLDSGKITVSVNNRNQLKYLKIALLENDPSDSLRNFVPYVSFDVKNNPIEIQGINVIKKFSLWLYTDENNDSKPDWYKPLNYLTNVSGDTTVTLEPKNWDKPFTIRKITTDGKSAKLYYDHNLHYNQNLFKIVGENIKGYYYYNEDSAFLPINYLNIPFQKIDTVNNLNVNNELSNIILKNLNIIEGKNNYLIYYDVPQSFQNSSTQSKIEKNQFNIKSLPDSFFIDNPDKTKTVLIKTNTVNRTPSNKLGYLGINIKSKSPDLYDIRIIKDGKDFLYLTDLNKYETLLQPGNYKIEIYERSFMNEFNPFILKSGSRLIYTKQFDLRASWEEIMNVNLE